MMTQNFSCAGVLAQPDIQARLVPLTPAQRQWLAVAAGWQRDAGGRWQAGPGADWPAPLWAAIIDEILSLPERPAAALRARLGLIALRVDARLRARHETPPTAREQAIRIRARREAYGGFFALETYHLTHPRHDGTTSAEMDRVVLVSGDAVVVLPYDAARGRVLLIEQFRPGVMARGDGDPWLIETVAGRIDAGETPQATARREAREEAGLDLGDLVALPAQYPSPAGQTEFVYGYIGAADLPDSAAGRGGLADEHEDIRSLIVPLDAALAMAEDGRIRNGPLLLALFWLDRHRAELNARFGG